MGNQEKSLVVAKSENELTVISNNLSKALSIGSRPAAKTFIGQLEELPREQLREVMLASCGNVLEMCQLVELSMDFDGGDEHSPVIAALEPEEIGDVLTISSDIFNREICFLIHPDDYSNPQKWLSITDRQKKKIEESGDKNLIERISSLNGNDDPRGHRKDLKSKWLLHVSDVSVSREAATSYVNAICNADRENEWKEECLEAVGMEMLRFVFDCDDEIRAMCRMISPVLTDGVMAMEVNYGEDSIADRNSELLDRVSEIKKKRDSENKIKKEKKKGGEKKSSEEKEKNIRSYLPEKKAIPPDGDDDQNNLLVVEAEVISILGEEGVKIAKEQSEDLDRIILEGIPEE